MDSQGNRREVAICHDLLLLSLLGAYKEFFLVKVTGQVKRKKESCYKLRNEEVCLFNNSKTNPKPSLHLFVLFCSQKCILPCQNGTELSCRNDQSITLTWAPLPKSKLLHNWS